MTDAIWQGLAEAGRAARETRILALFERDPERFDAFSVRLGDMLLDFSKTAIDARSLTLLIELAAARGVPERRDAMFTGARINTTENRPVLHVALRAARASRSRRRQERRAGGRGDARPHGGLRRGRPLGRDARRDRRQVHRRRQHRHRRLRSRAGDGDAGARALPRRAARCTSSRTSTAPHIARHAGRARPARTLFIVASKTFTTIETMTNAAHAARPGSRRRSARAPVGAISRRCRPPLDKAPAFGIDADRIFGFWDWVGGRYSIWSAIGLPLMIAIGPRELRRVPGRRARDGRSFPHDAARRRTCRCCWACRHLVPQRHGLPDPRRAALRPAARAASRPISSSSTWNRTASGCTLDGAPVADAPPARSSAASPAPTASTPSTSCSTRGPTSIPCDFLVAAAARARARATTTTCCSPTAWPRPRR